MNQFSFHFSAKLVYHIESTTQLTSHVLILPHSMNLLFYSIIMEAQSRWNKMVHATFRKVVAFDLVFMGLGIVIGAGVGAYLVTAGLIQ